MGWVKVPGLTGEQQMDTLTRLRRLHATCGCGDSDQKGDDVQAEILFEGEFAGKTAAPSYAGDNIPWRNRFFKVFFEEKGLPIVHWTLRDNQGTPHQISNQSVLEFVHVAPPGEQRGIENMIRRIDFANGDVNDYLKHLAGALINHPEFSMKLAMGKLRRLARGGLRENFWVEMFDSRGRRVWQGEAADLLEDNDYDEETSRAVMELQRGSYEAQMGGGAAQSFTLKRTASMAVTSNQIAKTILDQMGGMRRLQSMIGARNFVHDSNSVSFKWPSRQGAKKGNYLKITLRGDDTYDMEFMHLHNYRTKTVQKYEGVYAEDLSRLFVEQTGLLLRIAASALPTSRRADWQTGMKDDTPVTGPDARKGEGSDVPDGDGNVAKRAWMDEQEATDILEDLAGPQVPFGRQKPCAQRDTDSGERYPPFIAHKATPCHRPRCQHVPPVLASAQSKLAIDGGGVPKTQCSCCRRGKGGDGRRWGCHQHQKRKPLSLRRRLART